MPELTDLKHLLIDMDGVLWRGDEPLLGLPELFETLRARDTGFMLLTNNSMRTPESYARKLAKFGAEVAPEQILTSSLATAAWLKGQLEPGATIFAVGMEGVHEAMSNAGFNPVLQDVPDAADAVVVGLCLQFDYLMLHHAARLARDGALFVGTNPDTTFPMPGGKGPGAGSILAGVTAAAEREPVVIGKPFPAMYETALATLEADPATTAMLGDRLDTDIKGGIDAGLHTALVFTGVTHPADLNGHAVQPTWVFDDIVAFRAALDN